MMNKLFLFSVVVVISFLSCKKEPFFTDNSARLTFSADTIQFDTVFTTIGSATQNFKVYNPYSKPLKISSITLAKGNNSFFRLNINGASTRRIENVEIDAKDSLYIFVEVHVEAAHVRIAEPLHVHDTLLFQLHHCVVG